MCIYELKSARFFRWLAFIPVCTVLRNKILKVIWEAGPCRICTDLKERKHLLMWESEYWSVLVLAGACLRIGEAFFASFCFNSAYAMFHSFNL